MKNKISPDKIIFIVYLYYPLVLPAVKPLIKNFWNIKANTMGGKEATNPEAAI